VVVVLVLVYHGDDSVPLCKCWPDWNDRSATTFQTDNRWLDHGVGTTSAKICQGTALLDEQIRKNIIASPLLSSPLNDSFRRIQRVWPLALTGSKVLKTNRIDPVVRAQSAGQKPGERDLYMIAPNVTLQRQWEKNNDSDENASTKDRIYPQK
jgi:hypothetical protein